MKFCNVTSVHPRNDVRIFHKHCFVQSLRGEVHLVVADRKPDEIKENIHIHGVNGFKNRFLRMIFAVWAVYRKAKSIKADVYILHDPELLTIALSLKKRGAKVFFDSHECYRDCIRYKIWLNKYFRKCVAKIYEYIESKILPRLDGVIAATEYIGELLSKYNKDVIVVHNYVLLKEISKNEKPDIEHSNCVLYCGGIAKDRGILNMIKVLEFCHNDIKLILCGTFSPAGLLNECKQLTGWKNVKYMGFCERRQVYNLSKKCFCGLVFFDNSPNNKNGLPNKIFEYAGMFLPILASNFPHWKKIICDEKQPFGFVMDYNDLQKIAEMIDMLYENKLLAKQLGENGRKMVKTKYNFESEVKDFFYLK